MTAALTPTRFGLGGSLLGVFAVAEEVDGDVAAALCEGQGDAAANAAAAASDDGGFARKVRRHTVRGAKC